MGAQAGAAVSRGVQCADGCGAAWAAGALGEGAWDVAECGDGARGGGAFERSDGDGLRSVSFFYAMRMRRWARWGAGLCFFYGLVVSVVVKRAG